VTMTAMWNGQPIFAQFSPDNTQDGGNVAGTFVGWEGIAPDGFSETTFDSHSGIQAGVLADILVGTPPGVPEPSTWAMMLVGFAGLGYAAFRTRKSAHHRVTRRGVAAGLLLVPAALRSTARIAATARPRRDGSAAAPATGWRC